MIDDRELDTRIIIELIDKFIEIFDGHPKMETLAALMSLSCEIVTSCANDIEDINVMFNAAMMMLSSDISARIERGECAWQNDKQ